MGSAAREETPPKGKNRNRRRRSKRSSVEIRIIGRVGVTVAAKSGRRVAIRRKSQISIVDVEIGRRILIPR